MAAGAPWWVRCTERAPLKALVSSTFSIPCSRWTIQGVPGLPPVVAAWKSSQTLPVQLPDIIGGASADASAGVPPLPPDEPASGAVAPPVPVAPPVSPPLVPPVATAPPVPPVLPPVEVGLPPVPSSEPPAPPLSDGWRGGVAEVQAARARVTQRTGRERMSRSGLGPARPFRNLEGGVTPRHPNRDAGGGRGLLDGGL